MNPTSEILARMENSSRNHPEGIFTRLYRYLLREDIYMEAYKSLYANNGASTGIYLSRYASTVSIHCL